MRAVGCWELEQLIGSGSFAVVWRARHHESGQVAAVKEINTSKLNGKLQSSLASEVSVLQRTKHLNLVGLLDIVKEQDRLFLVLEYCGGGDLGHFLRRFGAVPENVAHHLLRQLAQGLHAMRKLNLMHRDLKPQNLLLMDSSRMPALKIADFGFARNLQPQGLAETLCGSPLYMAPEILQLHKYDAKADLWSVGVILFELLVGKPPYNGVNHLQLLQNIERGEGAKLPAHVSANISPACKQLLQQLLRRNPLERIGYEEFFAHPFFASNNTAPEMPITQQPAMNTASVNAAPQLQQQQATEQARSKLSMPQQPPTNLQSSPAQDFRSNAGGMTSSVGPRSMYGSTHKLTFTGGPSLGAHEATGITAKAAIATATSSTPQSNWPQGGSQHMQASAQETSTFGVHGQFENQYGGEQGHDTVMQDAQPGLNAEFQYTDIDLGPPSSNTQSILGSGGHNHYRMETPGGLSVIEEVDDYVVVSTDVSPTNSQHTAMQTGITRQFSNNMDNNNNWMQGSLLGPHPTPNASVIGNNNAGGSGSVSRGRGAWDALSRVGPALLPPRLVASAASQLRHAAASSHVNNWVAPLGQLAAHVSNVAQFGTGWHGSVEASAVNNQSKSQSNRYGSGRSDQDKVADVASAVARSSSNKSRDTSQTVPATASKPTTQPAVSDAVERPYVPITSEELAKLSRVPQVENKEDLLQRVLHVLCEAALRTWDAAVVQAEHICEDALQQVMDTSTDTPATQQRHEQNASRLSSTNAPSPRHRSGNTVGNATQQHVDEKSRKAAMLAGARAAAPCLQHAAAELVALHLLCCQMLAAALQQSWEPMDVPPSPTQHHHQAAGAHRHTLLVAHTRSLLEPLKERTAAVRHLLAADQPLPDTWAVLYNTAVELGRTAALDEVLGQYSASVQAYAKAADLLLFLLTCDSSSWGVLQALPAQQAAATHQLYVAVRVRQSLCMKDLNAEIKKQQSTLSTPTMN